MKPPTKPQTLRDLEAFQQDMKEWWKAFKRLTACAKDYRGDREKAVTAWLLDFLHKKLRDLSAGQFSDTMWEAIRFSFDAGFLRPGLKGGVISGPRARLDLNELLAIQKPLARAVSDILSERYTDLPVPQGQRRISVRMGAWTKKRLPLFIIKRLQDGFLFWATELLDRHAACIAQCNICKEVFLARREGTKNHEACRRREAMRKKRGTPKERYGKPGRPPKKKEG